MDSIGFGLVGCGMISNWHAEAIKSIKDARLVGAADLNERARNDFAGKYNIKAYSTIDELLEDPEVNTVCICTPSGLHAPLSIKAANAGKNVVVEKPMALNLKEADEMIRACELHHVKLSVIFQSRFFDAARKVKAAVEGGMLGKLISGDVYMKFYRSEAYYQQSAWKGTWKMDGGGALMNQGIHGIDLLLYIMGPVKSVFGHTRTLARSIEVEDTAAAVVEYENGALGVIQGTTSIYPGAPRRLEINGDKGSILMEEDNITGWEIEGRQVSMDMIPGDSNNHSFNNPEDFEIEGHILQLSDFVDAVKNDRRPYVDMYEGRKSIELITAIYESSRIGKLISIG